MIKRLLILTVVLLTGCHRSHEQAAAEYPPERIISLAPNITDTLFDLGLGNRVVGVSKFSNSGRAEGLPIVGDFMNINYEIVVSLKPDLVILERSADTQKARLESLGIPYLETSSLSIEDIRQSIADIGQACGAQEQAGILVNHFAHCMNLLRNTPGDRPRTLMTFSDFSNHAEIEQVFAFGADCIHSELLAMSGGDNVVSNARPSVVLSREALIRMNPDLIIELSTGGPTNHWDGLPSIAAVKNKRIYVLDGTYTTIPSPHCLILTLEDLSKIIREYTP